MIAPKQRPTLRDQAEMPPPVSADSSIYDKQLAWKLHGQRKLASKSQELRAQQEQECTFAPKIRAKLARSDEGEEEDDTVDTEAALLHPTEAQESSILLHLARQERAREHASEAQHKLNGTHHPKDFSKVTAVEPFALSTTNWKPRDSTTESPTREVARVCDAIADESKSTGKKIKAPRGSTKPPACAASTKEDGAWESERATLVSIIDAQRRELELREQAQQEAVRVAERFAAATQAFEERLVAVEQTVGKELEELKRLLAAQAASTDLILTSLGITRRPSPDSGRYD